MTVHAYLNIATPVQLLTSPAIANFLLKRKRNLLHVDHQVCRWFFFDKDVASLLNKSYSTLTFYDSPVDLLGFIRVTFLLFVFLIWNSFDEKVFVHGAN